MGKKINCGAFGVCSALLSWWPAAEAKLRKRLADGDDKGEKKEEEEEKEKK
jgi:hypothetical protein